ncbi:glycoside hydrolase family 71 protein [Streptomyces sp. NPDC090306]|uniref:glycoside hydrolase family 71 protein n=1 Tax=Streptomyces sp. NPDC090306 TaxID=3365961 RepID=UPI00381B391D
MMDANKARAGGHAAPHRGGRRAGLAALLGLLLLVVAAGTGLALTTRSGTSEQAAPSSTATGSGADMAADALRAPLPFDIPSTARLRDSEHLVFAHYFTPYPLSLDNRTADEDYYTRNYLDPAGEQGKHAAYGGLLRDRPQPVPSKTGDWQLADMEQEVRTAIGAGIDGFSVDLLSLSGPNWDRVRLLMRAAQAVDPGFRIMPMPDMTALHTDPATLAKALGELAASPNAYRLGDGRLVVSPFKAEAQSVDWWRQVMASLSGQHGTKTALVPLFLQFAAHAEEFAPISYGFSAWGSRSYNAQEHITADVELAHKLGKKWMQPVSVQDARPNQGIYDEAGNTETLRATWTHAIDDGADWVQLTTWNDYSETTQFAPSLHNGYTYLDLSSYYLTRFKTGDWPAVVRDTVYVTSRTQFAAATAGQRKPMTLRGGSAPARDTVEVLTFLAGSATVNATSGSLSRSYRADEGVHAELLPLRTGLATAAVVRDGRTTTKVTTHYQVTDSPEVQDMQYYGVTSGRVTQ